MEIILQTSVRNHNVFHFDKQQEIVSLCLEVVVNTETQQNKNTT